MEVSANPSYLANIKNIHRWPPQMPTKTSKIALQTWADQGCRAERLLISITQAHWLFLNDELSLPFSFP